MEAERSSKTPQESRNSSHGEFQIPASVFNRRKPRRQEDQATKTGTSVSSQQPEDDHAKDQSYLDVQAKQAREEASKGASPQPPCTNMSGVSGAGHKPMDERVGCQPPNWASSKVPPYFGLSLTVLKGGIEVGKISLNGRTRILLGESI